MIFACVNVRFKEGIPNVNFDEAPTYHEMDYKIIPPRRLPRPGDTVVIKTIGMPQVKLIVDRMQQIPDPDGRTTALGGPICGKASFYDPVDKGIPWADQDTVQGGLSPA